jgi:hypothetical protein
MLAWSRLRARELARRLLLRVHAILDRACVICDARMAYLSLRRSDPLRLLGNAALLHVDVEAYVDPILRVVMRSGLSALPGTWI